MSAPAVSLTRPHEEPDSAPTRAERALTVLRQAASTSPRRRAELQREVVLDHLDVAESLARRYRHRGTDQADLVQVADLALVEAVERFDPDRGEFLAFVVPSILGSLKRYFRDHGWMVRPPRRIQDLQAEIGRTWSELAQELGHAPSTEDLASRLDRSPSEVAEARGAQGCFRPASLDAPYGDGPTALAGTLADAESGYGLVDIVTTLGPPCHDLSPTDRRLLHLRFFEQLTQREIAAELGVSQMQVSRSLSRILEVLKHHLDTPQNAV